MANPAAAGQALTGTVTFLLTDVEGSTRLWERSPEHAAQLLGRQAEIIAGVVARRGGLRPEEQGEGDSTVSVFGSAVAAVGAALDIQLALTSEPWPDETPVRVRMAVHSGEATMRDARNYTGPTIHRCARLRDIAHGGQTVLSAVTAALVERALPQQASLADLGTHRLRDLTAAEGVFELRHPRLTREFPPLRSLDAIPNNLPLQLTSFLGREAELDMTQRVLDQARLACLTGAGGCGKTRLAAQAAGAAAERFADGVWWVDLAPVTRPDQVAALTASAIDLVVEPMRGPLHALSQQLRDRRLLVCLDNCEHVLDAAAELVTTLLAAGPGVTVLATSREPLGIPGEVVIRVPSLAEDAAMRLFADRAAHARPGFTIDAGTGQAVRAICRRLDGIPLAIELAAAWTRVLSSSEIAAGLDDQFRLLAGGPRGVSARQQTLLASIDWSHDLLDPPERALLRRLGVFAGGCSLHAAQAVCASQPLDDERVLETLAHLVDKSLVIVEASDGAVRYRLLETMRQYAQRRLHEAHETSDTRDRHLRHFLELAQHAEPELEGADQDRWATVLEAEADNIRAALDWGLSSAEPELGQRLAAALAHYWGSHGHCREGLQVLERALACSPDERTLLRARLLAGSAFVSGAAGRLELTALRSQEALDLALSLSDDRTISWCLTLQAHGLLYFDLEACRRAAEQAEQHAASAGSPFLIDSARLLHGLAFANQDRDQDGRALLDAAVSGARERGDRLVGAFALTGRTLTRHATGDVRAALASAHEALALARPLGDYFAAGQMTCWVAWSQITAGQLDDARATMEPLVAAVGGEDSYSDVLMLPVTMGRLELFDGALERAVGWLRRAARWAEPLVDNLMVAWALPLLASALRRTGAVDEAAEVLARATELTRRLQVPNLIAATLDERARTLVDSDVGAAEALHHQALTLRVDRGLRTYEVDSLDALAEIASRREAHEAAVRLLAASDAARAAMGCPRPPVALADHERLVADVRHAIGDSGLATAWQQGAALDLDAAVSYARRARGERGRPSTGWESLTPTEEEVVRLVARGLTNAEIGAQLFMSRATVKTHLSHSYAKLGLGSRAELAAAVARRPPAAPPVAAT